MAAATSTGEADAKRLKIQIDFGPFPGSIVATKFNRTGDIFAYALAYDWSKGHTGMTTNHPNKIMLHPCKPEEVKKRTVQ